MFPFRSDGAPAPAPSGAAPAPAASQAPAGEQVPQGRAVVITPYRDGPLLVRGPVRLLGPDGVPIELDRDPVALCRCGRSRLRPFCDGTHKLTGFRAEA